MTKSLRSRIEQEIRDLLKETLGWNDAAHYLQDIANDLRCKLQEVQEVFDKMRNASEE